METGIRIVSGKVYRSQVGEAFGPMKQSFDAYHLPYYCIKFGQVYTFHANGRYSSNPEQAHFLDLVA